MCRASAGGGFGPRGVMAPQPFAACIAFLSRPQACVIPRCENVGRRSCRTPSARNDRAISAVFRDRSARGAADSRQFSPRGLLWLFLRKKEQGKDFLQKMRVESCGAHAQNGGPPLAEASARAALSATAFRSAVVQAGGLQVLRKDIVLPPFATKRWRQKCPQGTSVGIEQRFSLSGHERLRCFAHPLRALEPPSDLFPPAVHCGGCGALRAQFCYFLRQASGLRVSAM